jgi:CoA:oxalate CoA-transferase
MEGPTGDHIRVAGNPIKFTGESEPQHRYPPALGADQADVLQNVLGYTQERIDGLLETGVIGSRKNAKRA